MCITEADIEIVECFDGIGEGKLEKALAMVKDLGKKSPKHTDTINTK
ncbi:MAG: hypothetical protein WA063_04915 [Minisyncoccia bacterium]